MRTHYLSFWICRRYLFATHGCLHRCNIYPLYFVTFSYIQSVAKCFKNGWKLIKYLIHKLIFTKIYTVLVTVVYKMTQGDTGVLLTNPLTNTIGQGVDKRELNRKHHRLEVIVFTHSLSLTYIHNSGLQYFHYTMCSDNKKIRRTWGNCRAP